MLFLAKTLKHRWLPSQMHQISLQILWDLMIGSTSHSDKLQTRTSYLQHRELSKWSERWMVKGEKVNGERCGVWWKVKYERWKGEKGERWKVNVERWKLMVRVKVMVKVKVKVKWSSVKCIEVQWSVVKVGRCSVERWKVNGERWGEWWKLKGGWWKVKGDWWKVKVTVKVDVKVKVMLRVKVKWSVVKWSVV